MQTALYDPTGLIAGDYPVTTSSVTINAGTLQRGAVLGRIEDGGDAGTYVLSAAAASDGSQLPLGILAVDVDASGAPQVAPVYFSGEFASSRLAFGAGHDAASVEAAFRGAQAPLFVRILE